MKNLQLATVTFAILHFSKICVNDYLGNFVSPLISVLFVPFGIYSVSKAKILVDLLIPGTLSTLFIIEFKSGQEVEELASAVTKISLTTVSEMHLCL